MKCPYCGYTESKVIDSRHVDDNSAIKRRRECESCQKRFTTYEKIETLPIIVVKKDGSRETFSREKLLGGLIHACEKRPVPFTKLESLVDRIEMNLSNALENEDSSAQIGEMVMADLKEIDEVAYVRFASVYRQFKDLYTFLDELNKLIKENNKN